ncbi:hypothetical protein QBC37DRAFT_459566 [Rhypophila decipiens]|uniref:Uncharacterized protein n=1 Tax=Rhypophila decipiens TaxID=261697 RepID=A0AAN6Y9W8_9PEZI|nr:hypothetical protein QBC37DRAFT_459566 [Rhypophila decipiens]
MPGNKYRVYLAGFSRDGISMNPSLEPTLHKAMYHWGIWVEPKNSQGEGQLFHVEHHEPMNSSSGPIPGGWRYETRTSSARTSVRHVGRIMIGKLPSGTMPDDMEAFLASNVALPREGSDEDCITWTRSAILALQQKGWVEQFDVDECLDAAYETFKRWYASGGWVKANKKESFVKRKFP